MRDNRIIFPGYFIEKPLFQSLKNLRRLLGEQDSCFHSNQVSILFLEEYIYEHGFDNNNFIRELCDKFSISGGHKNWNITKQLMAKSYIVQTYNLQEIFFKDFKAEYCAYKQLPTWKDQKKQGGSEKKLDPYSQLLVNMPKDATAKFESTPESYAIQYYRILRNGIVHKSNTSLSKSTKFYEKYIIPQSEHFKKYYKFLPEGNLLPAPNSPSNLNHNDFFIYSRCLKNLISLIVNAGNLTIEEIIRFELKNNQFVSKMNKYNPNIASTRDKLLTSLSTFFTTKYGNLQHEKELFTQTYLEYRKNNNL